MTNRTIAVGIFAALLATTGCRGPVSTLELTSFKDPYFPERYRLELDECTYRLQGDSDVHVSGRAGHSTEGPDAVEQFLDVHVFWRPRPGKTYDNCSSIDATIRYAIITQRGAAVYSGSAYVYLRHKKFSDDFLVSIESARLKLESKVGDAPALLGDTKVVGELVASPDDAKTLQVAREVDRTAALVEWTAPPAD